MERALLSGPDAKKQLVGAGALVAAGAVAFFLGFNSELFNVRLILLLVFGVIGGAVLALPYQWAIRLLFAYLGFEGMAKIITNYNPIVHVGADLLVVALTVRWFLAYLLKRETVSERRPPLIPLFVLHCIWFLIEFMNPYSIGLVPSLAGAKVYLTMPLLYVFGFYLARDGKNVRWFMAVWVLTVLIQVVTGLYQASAGPQSVLRLSPGYAIPLQKFDASYAFRPFGTTNLPGGASLFVALATPFVLYFIFSARSWLVRLSLLGLLPGALFLVLVSQVRVQLMKMTLGSALFFFIALGWASSNVRKKLLVALPAVAAVILFAIPHLTENWVDDKRGIERSLTLFDPKLASQARAGAGERVIRYAKEVPLGAGLSRTGAAAGKFWAENNASPWYQNGFFTDNFWAATIAEMGIPGSAILTAIIFSVLFIGSKGIVRSRNPENRLLQAAVFCPLVTIVLGLWGAEGVLYNPESAFFWFFSGVLMRLARDPDVPVHL